MSVRIKVASPFELFTTEEIETVLNTYSFF